MTTTTTTVPNTPTSTTITESTAPHGDRYDAIAVESKWRDRWAQDQLYRAPDPAEWDPNKPKWYALTMFPYPSGDIHVGHWYAMVPADAAARYRRMTGHTVLFPMGFDAFGLPAERAAIRRDIHPYTWTMGNIERMRGQIQTMGTMFDWSREVITCQPDYYKWNQWFFVRLFKHGLAYRAKAPVWWDPEAQTVLANEQVIDGKSEYTGAEVYRRDLEQWFFRITDYAEELLDFSKLDWPERTKTLQRNWIGRSTGAAVTFHTEGGDPLEVFTTRPDTLWGATFMVLAPEHPLVDKITTPEQRGAVEQYKEATSRETEIDRQNTEKEKTGAWTGAYAINPVNGARVPIWIADYVLVTYGTGAIMAVPAHDERDLQFARKYGLDVIVVVQPGGGTFDAATMTEAYPGDGRMVNSGPLNGIATGESKAAAISWLETKGIGRARVTYRLRDWLISRQRYWGTPIPMIYTQDGQIVPVPESDLPVLLPPDAAFRATGESPLRTHPGFANTVSPIDGTPARRETDTMDVFMDSAWYMYRYVSPHFDEGTEAGPIDPKHKAWLPVDLYTGGIEHATMHLLYARFFAKAARDMGIIDFDEPFTRLFHQGIILGPDGNRMSKSRGNVINPDDYVLKDGTDIYRLALMFRSPWEMGGPWQESNVDGARRFVGRAWGAVEAVPDTSAGEAAAEDVRALRRVTHQTIRKATHDMETFGFNTMVSALMEFVNALIKARETDVVQTAAYREATEMLALMLAPIAPHLAEEMWARLGQPYSVHQQSWPQWDPDLARDEEVTIPVQVNGKVRDRLTAAPDATEETLRAAALASPRVQELLSGREPKKVIVVPGRLVNIVG